MPKTQSPFSWMRDNAPWLMVVVVVLMVVSMVFVGFQGDVTQWLTGDSGSPGDVVALEFNGRTLTAADSNAIVGAADAVSTFLLELQQKAQLAADDKAGSEPFDPKVAAPTILAELRQITGMEGSPQRELLLHQWVGRFLAMEQQAKDWGLNPAKISEAAYLSELTDGRLSAAEMNETLQDQLERRRNLGAGDLLGMLRRALAAERVYQLSVGGWDFEEGVFTTPVDLANSYLLLNRQVEAKFLPLKVADFTDDPAVGEPTEAEVQQLYEQGQSRMKTPDMQEPGFRRGPQIAVEYVAAPYDKFLKEAKRAVTPEQIEKYYNENPEMFRRTELPSGPDGPSTPSGEIPPPPEPRADESSEPANDGAQATPGDGGALGPPSGTQFVHFQPDATPDGDGSVAPPPLLNPPFGELAPKPTQDVKPLEEVREEVRERVAETQARQRADDALAKIEMAMAKYDAKYRAWAESPSGSPPPQPPLKDLADQLELNYGNTPLVGFFELRDDKVLGPAQALGAQPTRLIFALFDESVRQYEPIRGFSGGNDLVAWKTDSKEPYLPELSEVRGEVVDYWKRREALAVAMKAAKKLAEQAKAKGSLEEVAGQRKDEIVTPDAFSRYQFGGRGVVPTSVEELEQVGPEQLGDLFEAEPGATGVLTNAPESKLYVYRVLEVTPSVYKLGNRFQDSLRTDAIMENFLRSQPQAQFRPPLRSLAENQMFETAGKARQEWVDQLLEQYGVRVAGEER